MSFNDALISALSQTLGKAISRRFDVPLEDIQPFIHLNLSNIFYGQPQGPNIYLNPTIRKWMIKDTVFVVKSNREHCVVGKLKDGDVKALTESDEEECERLGVKIHST